VVNRRDFLIGAASGASSAVALGVAGRAMAGRPPDARKAPTPVAPVAPADAAGKSGPGAPKPEPLYEGRRSFAQQGEDLILYNLLHHELKLATPTYLDIGAGDPVLSNNTYALYCTGSRGVLLEPNPALVEKLKTVRPGDVVVNAGVGLKETSAADYYVIRGRWPLNTFSLEDVAEMRRQSDEDPVEKVIKLPLIQINELIAAHFTQAPDLLSIDIEGMDLAVLRTLDYRAHRPAAICAETKKPWMSHDNTPIARLLRRKGYVACAGSLYNTIFVDRSKWGQV
jgi:FkbM family methyltransferase